MFLQKVVLRLAIFTAAVFITDWFLVGVGFDTIPDALIVALLLGFFNTFIKPILKILTFPLTLMTLGFFPFIMNTVIILLIAQAIPGFRIFGDAVFIFFWAAAFGIILTVVNALLEVFVKIVD
ncbi:MAG: phage holin family protein [Microscillaceae bacterium]|nr:phage holin family protein [Microscillaceae bacterium]